MAESSPSLSERLPTLYQVETFVAYPLALKFLYDFLFGTLATELNAYLGLGYFLLMTIAHLDRARRERVGVFRVLQ